MRKSLLCISLGPSEDDLVSGLSRRGWAIVVAAQLAEAERLLYASHYLIGLLVLEKKLKRLGDVDMFLQRHRHMQWIGLFHADDLSRTACHDLIVDYLHDYHTFPIDLERLTHTLGHAHGLLRLCPPEVCTDPADLDTSALVGRSSSMMRLHVHVERVAQVTAPVLIWGESGTGKELVAQAIHARSARADKPFVPINCGAIARDLIHAELFGYERGAFTGATCSKPGLIERADGGTLFLDEIGDLPIDLQANLLRFLQEQSIQRLGSTSVRRVDVRVIAASHVDLEVAVRNGSFREDLYYRLAVLPIDVPALRERGDDVLLLATHFLRVFAHEGSRSITGFSDAALAVISRHTWPGNVRELINRIRRALVMADARWISPADLGFGCQQGISPAKKPAETRTVLAALRSTLERNGHNVSRAARDLGISRTTAYRLLGRSRETR